MKSFSLNDYEELVARSVILERDRHGIKVLLTPENLIVKLFRQKRLISSARLKSYATRFVQNSTALKRLKIKTVEVRSIAYCKPIKRTLVTYLPLPGETLRTVLHDLPHPDELLEKFVVFFADLHDKGVLFRSIHLNNVIVSTDLDTFGLIDIADMKIGSAALSCDKRKRNFRHLARYRADQELIKAFGVNRFMDIYFKRSELPDHYKPEFLASMQETFETVGRG